LEIVNRKIAAVLLKLGNDLFKAEPDRVVSGEDRDADALLNDIQGYLHAFVLMWIMVGTDRDCTGQVTATRGRLGEVRPALRRTPAYG